MSRPRLLVLLILLCVAIAFGRLVGADFIILDDPHNVRNNPKFVPPTLEGIAFFWTRPIAGLYIPITYTAWGALASLAQLETPDPSGSRLNPAVFHLANVAVHAGSALIVFALLRRLTRRDWPACAGALLFALHPVQVEAVAWVSGFKDVLCGLLALVALWQYVESTGAPVLSTPPAPTQAKPLTRRKRAPETPTTPPQPVQPPSRLRLHYLIGMIVLVLAMLTKPTAVVTPLLAATIDYFVLRRPARQVLRGVLPWVVLVIPFAILTKLVQPAVGVETGPLWTRPLVAADAMAFYLYKLVLPINLAMDYGRTPLVAIERGWIYWTWVAPAALAVALWLYRRRYPWLVAAGLIFVIGVGPVLGLSRFLFQYFTTVSDHYLYLSMLGPALAVAWFFSAADVRRPAWAARALTSVLVLLGLMTMVQAGYWRDDRTLWTRTLAVNPRSFMALNNLGVVYIADGEFDTAARHFARAIEIKPDYDRAHENYGHMLVRLGLERRDVAMIDRGLYHAQRALDLRAEWPEAIRWTETGGRFALGQAYVMRGRHAEAISQFEAVLRDQPDHPQAKAALAAARAALDRPSRPATTTVTTSISTTTPAAPNGP